MIRSVAIQTNDSTTAVMHPCMRGFPRTNLSNWTSSTMTPKNIFLICFKMKILEWGNSSGALYHLHNSIALLRSYIVVPLCECVISELREHLTLMKHADRLSFSERAERMHFLSLPFTISAPPPLPLSLSLSLSLSHGQWTKRRVLIFTHLSRARAFRPLLSYVTYGREVKESIYFSLVIESFGSLRKICSEI